MRGIENLSSLRLASGDSRSLMLTALTPLTSLMMRVATVPRNNENVARTGRGRMRRRVKIDYINLQAFTPTSSELGLA